jgi:hypothetical protein
MSPFNNTYPFHQTRVIRLASLVERKENKYHITGGYPFKLHTRERRIPPFAKLISTEHAFLDGMERMTKRYIH